jgi:hypothetical protein
VRGGQRSVIIPFFVQECAFMGRSYHARACCLLAFALATMAGCEQAKKEVKKAVQQTQQVVTEQAQNVTDKVQQKLNLVGKMELDLSPPVKTDGCYARLIGLAGRPAILQLTSYRADTHNAKADPPLPAIMIHAQIPAPDPAQLAGKTFKAQLFVQEQQGGRVLFTDAGQSVELAITAVDGQQLTAEISSGAVTNSESRQAQNIRGKLVGILQ